MQRVIKYILIAAVFLGGCQKKLNLVPKDTISDATFWKTGDDFKLAANALYFSLEGFDFADGEADIAYSVGNTISQGVYLPTETSDNWNLPFVTIRNCNNIIAKGTAFPNDAEINKYVAEAKFFRAYSYWRLLRLYGGVPVITEVLAPNDNTNLYKPRSTADETAQQILKDLTEAVTNLPAKTDVATADIGRITKAAANGLKARVALFMGTWEKYRSQPGADAYLDAAISASGSIINGDNGTYSLFTDMGAQSYRYLFIEAGDDCSETILDRRYQRNISGQSYPFLIDRAGYLATKKLADSYLCTDGLPVTKSFSFKGYNTRTAEYENRDPRMTMTFYIPGTLSLRVFFPTTPVPNWPFYPQRNPNTGYTTYKYMSEDPLSNALGEDGNSHSFDKHIIRYAEVLLIYAEATYEKNSAISDADLNKTINVIRQRVNMPPLTNAFASANGLNMLDEIRRERTVELALEGFRYDDIRRWKTAETEMVQDIKGVKIVGTDWTAPVLIGGTDRNVYGGASWQSNTDANGFIIVEHGSDRIFDPGKHYLRPLPTREIALYKAADKELAQNPGW